MPNSTLTHTELVLLTFVLYFYSIAFYVVWRRGFFVLPPDTKALNRTWFQTAKVFVLYIGLQSIVVPAFWVVLAKPNLEEGLSSLQQAQLNALAIFVSTLAVIAYAYWRNMFKPAMETSCCFLRGALVWFLSYPAMMLISQAVSLAVSHFYSGPMPEQVAIEHLKSTQDFPFLFYVTLLEIVLLVPIVEEILFRGYLHGWLRSLMGRWSAIGASSLVFALFHYSSSQKIYNFELIAALFILACFLGFLYEKYQNIWAPIGLHALFNGVSVVMILNS